MASDHADQVMDSLDEIDRRILASVIMSVDVTEVFSPARVNKLAAKFGLLPGASLAIRTVGTPASPRIGIVLGNS